LSQRSRVGWLEAHWYVWAFRDAPWVGRVLVVLVGLAVLLGATFVWYGAVDGVSPSMVTRAALHSVPDGVDLDVSVVNHTGAPSPPLSLGGSDTLISLGPIPAGATRKVHLGAARPGRVLLSDHTTDATWAVLPPWTEVTGVTGAVRVDWRVGGDGDPGSVTWACRRTLQPWMIDAGTETLTQTSED
jgi:hypothetical protein